MDHHSHDFGQEAFTPRYEVPRSIEPARADAAACMRKGVVTVLFTDIEGFTRLTEALPLERTADVLTQYYTTLLELAAETSATIDRFVGDGALFYWSRERHGGEHAALALKAAVRLRAILLSSDEGSRPRIAGGLPVRFGIHSGEAILGRFAESEQAETLLGDVVNVASRLQEAAKGLVPQADDGRVRGYVSLDTMRHLPPGRLPAKFDRLGLPGRRRAILAHRY